MKTMNLEYSYGRHNIGNIILCHDNEADSGGICSLMTLK